MEILKNIPCGKHANLLPSLPAERPSIHLSKSHETNKREVHGILPMLPHHPTSSAPLLSPTQRHVDGSKATLECCTNFKKTRSLFYASTPNPSVLKFESAWYFFLKRITLKLGARNITSSIFSTYQDRVHCWIMRSQRVLPTYFTEKHMIPSSRKPLCSHARNTNNKNGKTQKLKAKLQVARHKFKRFSPVKITLGI